MRLLVIGAGVLGCNLAANLYEAGKNVTLLARGEWYSNLQKRGLVIKHQLFPRVVRYKIGLTNQLKKTEEYDAIFICVQFTQLDEIVTLLSENVSQNIIFIGNNLRPREYAKRLKGKNVMFGFALSAGHREANAVVSIDLKKITIGDLKGETNNQRLIKHIFHRTRYQVKYESDIESYLLCHAAIVLPACYACYCADGDLKKLAANHAFLQQVINANIELYRVMKKLGYQLLPKELNQYSSPWYYQKSFWFYKLMSATPLGKLCASDHAMSAMTEMAALAAEVDLLIVKSGLETPNYRELQSHQKYI